jgi:hypothetical protein
MPMLSRARALWRTARRAPGVSGVLTAVDRMWWAHVIRRADIVDPDVVAAQAGRPLSARAAVRRYVRGGFREGFVLNPLLMERTVSRQLSDADRVPALYAYLVNDRERLAVSPNWDAPALAREQSAALQDPAGPLGYAWRRARREGWVLLGSGQDRVRVPWSEVVAALRRPLPPTGRSGTASALFVCVLGSRESDADRALSLAADAAQSLQMDVDVIVTGSSDADWVHASLLPLHAPRVVVRSGSARDAAPPADIRDALTVYRGPDAAIGARQLRGLVDAADRPVAALWLAPDGTIASAGTLRYAGRQVDLLAGHPAEDARRVGERIAVPALAGPVRAWPAGTEPSGAGDTLTGVAVLAPAESAPPPASQPAESSSADIDALLGPAGFAVDAAGSADGLRLRRVPLPGAEALPRRWAIKTAAPAGAAGEAWGDTHFARGIAAALQRQGDQAVVDSYQAAGRASSRFDDVTLVLRGPERIMPPRSGVRILWIISHPDQITADELADFDHVFAGSASWARRASERFGRRIDPLLQCTDVTRFHPTGAARTDEIVFVGTARGIPREVVLEPVAAGVPVQVYGPDWRGWIPASAIVATGIANDRLPALYERAGVVLNDHWPAMRREGFISNRLYDVVAAGGRAVSDDVEGIADVFGEAVRVYRTPQEMVTLLQGDLDDAFPDAGTLAAIGARIRADHSFDARATALRSAAAGDAGGPRRSGRRSG